MVETSVSDTLSGGAFLGVDALDDSDSCGVILSSTSFDSPCLDDGNANDSILSTTSSVGTASDFGIVVSCAFSGTSLEYSTSVKANDCQLTLRQLKTSLYGALLQLATLWNSINLRAGV